MWPRKLNITKMSLPDVNSICLNSGQKYNTYLSHAFSRKNLPYWLMCRKTRIFAILANMGHFQNWISLQIGQYGSKWESQLVWSPRRGFRQNHDIIIWKYQPLKNLYFCFCSRFRSGNKGKIFFHPFKSEIEIDYFLIWNQYR